MKSIPPEIYLVLHNIRSSHNVGSIFRTADAAGVAKILLTGYTPAPRDRFGRTDAQIAKVALGAEKTMPWEQEKSVGRALAKLAREDFHTIALEQHPNSRDYSTVKVFPKTALILGNEVRGLSKQILSRTDVIAEIPMCGRKESLNVSVAAGIMLFQLLKS